MSKQEVSAVFLPLKATIKNDIVILTNSRGLALVEDRATIEGRLGERGAPIVDKLDAEGETWVNTGTMRARILGLSSLAGHIEAAYEAAEQ